MKRFGLIALVAAVALVPLFAIGIFALGLTVKNALAVASLLAVGMAIPIQPMRDAGAAVSKTLPGSGTTVTNTGHDLQIGENANAHCGLELVIESPELTTVQLADAATIAYAVYHDSDSAFGTEASLYGTVLTVTGAGGAGAAATTKRVGLPRGIGRYIRVKATLSTGDCSASSYVTRLEPIKA